MRTLRTARTPKRSASIVALGTAALLLAGCSTDSLLERGLSMIEGVEGVDIDTDSGSISIRGQEGELFEMEIDEETGDSTFTTEEGTVTTSTDNELPSEIAAVFAPPASFQPVSVSDFLDGDNRAVMAQGPITGEWEPLMDQIEAAVQTGPWDEVMRQAMAPGVMGSVMGTQEGDDAVQLMVNLIIDEGAPEGMLQIVLLLPVTE